MKRFKHVYTLIIVVGLCAAAFFAAKPAFAVSGNSWAITFTQNTCKQGGVSWVSDPYTDAYFIFFDDFEGVGENQYQSGNGSFNLGACIAGSKVLINYIGDPDYSFRIYYRDGSMVWDEIQSWDTTNFILTELDSAYSQPTEYTSAFTENDIAAYFGVDFNMGVTHAISFIYQCDYGWIGWKDGGDNEILFETDDGSNNGIPRLNAYAPDPPNPDSIISANACSGQNNIAVINYADINNSQHEPNYQNILLYLNGESQDGSGINVNFDNINFYLDPGSNLNYSDLVYYDHSLTLEEINALQNQNETPPAIAIAGTFLGISAILGFGLRLLFAIFL
jgi:hypothetical protein